MLKTCESHKYFETEGKMNVVLVEGDLQHEDRDDIFHLVFDLVLKGTR